MYTLYQSYCRNLIYTGKIRKINKIAVIQLIYVKYHAEIWQDQFFLFFSGKETTWQRTYLLRFY